MTVRDVQTLLKETFDLDGSSVRGGGVRGWS